jgi:hypothetical protein
MRKIAALLCAGALAMSTGCAYLGGGTDLSDVADAAGLSNVTTGDGEYSKYTATGYYTGTELGIAIGIPFILKLIEVYPAASNEALLTDVAKAAKADGAEAMINVTPHTELYTGIPFFLVGVYVDTASGTGIKAK